MNFWAKKLGGETPTGPATRVTMWTPNPTPAPQPDQPEGSISEMLAHGQPPVRTKAKSALLYDTCPECGSANYGPVWSSVVNVTTGMTSRVTRCYDCGYPVTQAGSGDTLRGQAGMQGVRPARQISRSGVVTEPFAHI